MFINLVQMYRFIFLYSGCGWICIQFLPLRVVEGLCFIILSPSLYWGLQGLGSIPDGVPPGHCKKGWRKEWRKREREEERRMFLPCRGMGKYAWWMPPAARSKCLCQKRHSVIFAFYQINSCHDFRVLVAHKMIVRLQRLCPTFFTNGFWITANLCFEQKFPWFAKLKE